MAEAVAKVTGAEVSSVKVAMRFLREAGLLTQGAHGVNAPDMTARDLSHAVIAFLAYETPGRRAVTAVQEIGSLVVFGGEPYGSGFTLEGLGGLEAPFTFAEALAALIEIYAFHWDTDSYRSAEREMRDGSIMPPACVVEICDEGDFGASIKMGPWRDNYTAQYFFGSPIQPIAEARAALKRIPGVQSIRWISERNIKPLAEDFAGMA